MPATDHQNGARKTGASSQEASLTWTVTDTFSDTAPLALLAEATGLSIEVLAAHPASLRGTPSPGLRQLLVEREANATAVLEESGETEVVTVHVAQQPTLAELVDAARQAVRGEVEHPSTTGVALAALLAGLRREQLIDR